MGLFDKFKSGLKGKLNNKLNGFQKNLHQKVEGKILDKIKKETGLDSPIFSEFITSDIFNNPTLKRAEKQYKSKPEVFSTFVKPGIPHIIFEAKELTSVGTESSKNAELWKGNTSIEGSETLPKEAKIPISPDFLKSSYSFDYEASGKIDTSDVTKTLTDLAQMKLKEGTDGSKAARAASLSTGVAVNPNMENAFVGVDFRKLNFSFELIPKNKEQNEEISKMIHMFKFWAHPEVYGQDGIKLLKYPYVWVISYNDGKNGSSGVSFKSKPSYCTSINVEYGSSNGYSLFKEENGNTPTSVKITLSFTENEYITRRDITVDNSNGGIY